MNPRFETVGSGIVALVSMVFLFGGYFLVGDRDESFVIAYYSAFGIICLLSSVAFIVNVRKDYRERSLTNIPCNNECHDVCNNENVYGANADVIYDPRASVNCPHTDECCSENNSQYPRNISNTFQTSFPSSFPPSFDAVYPPIYSPTYQSASVIPSNSSSTSSTSSTFETPSAPSYDQLK